MAREFVGFGFSCPSCFASFGIALEREFWGEGVTALGERNTAAEPMLWTATFRFHTKRKWVGTVIDSLGAFFWGAWLNTVLTVT